MVLGDGVQRLSSAFWVIQGVQVLSHLLVGRPDFLHQHVAPQW